MLIIGCDFHTRYQQIAMADDETGELRVPHPCGFQGAGFDFLSSPLQPQPLARYPAVSKRLIYALTNSIFVV